MRARKVRDILFQCDWVKDNEQKYLFYAKIQFKKNNYTN